jgi:hypothetical protein
LDLNTLYAEGNTIEFEHPMQKRIQLDLNTLDAEESTIGFKHPVCRREYNWLEHPVLRTE